MLEAVSSFWSWIPASVMSLPVSIFSILKDLSSYEKGSAIPILHLHIISEERLLSCPLKSSPASFSWPSLISPAILITVQESSSNHYFHLSFALLWVHPLVYFSQLYFPMLQWWWLWCQCWLFLSYWLVVSSFLWRQFLRFSILLSISQCSVTALKVWYTLNTKIIP